MPCQGPYGGYQGDSYYSAYLQAERELCEARWLILQLTAGGVPEKLRDQVAKIRAEQLSHRVGDRDHVLDAIKRTLQRLDHDEKEILKLGGQPGDRFTDQRAKLTEARARIRAFTNEELLEHYWGNEERLNHDVVDHT